MTDVIKTKEIIHSRLAQPSYHLASEEDFRVQICNLLPNDTWENKLPMSVLLITLQGEIIVSIDNTSETLSMLDQMIVPRGKTLKFSEKSSQPAIVQLIWSQH